MPRYRVIAPDGTEFVSRPIEGGGRRFLVLYRPNMQAHIETVRGIGPRMRRAQVWKKAITARDMLDSGSIPQMERESLASWRARLAAIRRRLQSELGNSKTEDEYIAATIARRMAKIMSRQRAGYFEKWCHGTKWHRDQEAAMADARARIGQAVDIRIVEGEKLNEHQ